MLLMSPRKAFDLEVRLAPVRQQAGGAAGLEPQSWQDPPPPCHGLTLCWRVQALFWGHFIPKN